MKKVFVFDSSILSACYTKELGSAFERMEAMKDKIWFPEYLVKEFKTKKRTDDYYVRLMKRKKISELQRKIARFVFGHPDVISMDLSNDYTSWIFNEAARTHYLIQAFEQYARDNRYGKLQIIFITAVNPDCEFQYGLNFHDYALQPAYRGFKIHFPEESIFPKKCVLPKNLIDDYVKNSFRKYTNGSSLCVYDAEQFFSMPEKAFRHLVFDEPVMSDADFMNEMSKIFEDDFHKILIEAVAKRFNDDDVIEKAIMNKNAVWENIDDNEIVKIAIPINCFDTHGFSCTNYSIRDELLSQDLKNWLEGDKTPIDKVSCPLKYEVAGYTNVSYDIETMSRTWTHKEQYYVTIEGNASLEVEIKYDKLHKLDDPLNAVNLCIIYDDLEHVNVRELHFDFKDIPGDDTIPFA